MELPIHFDFHLQQIFCRRGCKVQNWIEVIDTYEFLLRLGDFAILLAAGFTVKKAIVVNLLSSLTAFVGLYIGISVGEDFRIWIIAAGAGMFLYISMVTMVSG